MASPEVVKLAELYFRQVRQAPEWAQKSHILVGHFRCFGGFFFDWAAYAGGSVARNWDCGACRVEHGICFVTTRLFGQLKSEGRLSVLELAEVAELEEPECSRQLRLHASRQP